MNFFYHTGGVQHGPVSWEGLREAVARASSSFDRYTRQLHQLGLESSEREVKWLNELIAAERAMPGLSEQT